MQGSELQMASEAFSQLPGTGGSVTFLSEETVAQQVMMNEIFKNKKQKLAVECGN